MQWVEFRHSAKSENAPKRKKLKVVGFVKKLKTAKNWIFLFLFMEMHTKRTFGTSKEKAKTLL